MQDSDRTIGAANTIGKPADAPTLQPFPADETPTLPCGTVLAGRYQIIDLLGVGGMGAVYKAFDRQLTRVVALKTILAEMAATPTALKRFKQEVVLAQSIVHKNIVRIFDIGEDGDTKFITMDFIEGADLKHLIVERGKLPPLEAAGIIRQVCSGLEAAHAAGVIHRDLKPQNIMMQSNGQVIVMDFGIAGSGQSRGATQTGAFLGTPDYMSPEQAQTEPVDARSDIFSLGLIFSEMLTGKLPFQGKTVLETMFKRTTERAVAPVEIDPSIPKSANDIVVKCLQKDREQRYQSVTALLEDLETFDPTKKVGAADRARARLKKAARYRTWAAACAGILLAVAIGYVLRSRVVQKPPQQHPATTVLVADFSNGTGDPIFDGTLEPMLNIALEGASFVNAYDRGRARKVGAEIQPGATRLDEALARLVAGREGIHIIVTGAIVQDGKGYTVTERAVDAFTGKEIAAEHVTAPNKDAVLPAVAKLATPIRTALGDTTPESAQIAAMETVTASSLHTAHLYAVAQETNGAGNREEAARQFQEIIDLDPSFARAYCGAAVAYVSLKNYPKAGEYYKQALRLLDHVSEREKYRTLGVYYASYVHNYQTAIENLQQLVSLYPADAAGYNNLAVTYALNADIPDALAALRKALEITPNNLQRRSNYASDLMLNGEFDSAIAETQRVLKDRPSFEYAFLPMTLATLAKGDAKGARDIYAQLEKVSPRGYSVAKMGTADLEMYLGHYEEALRILEDGIAADQKEKNTGEMALKYVAKAEANLARGRRPQAIEAADKAVQLSPVESVLFPAARVLLHAGADAKARKLASALEDMLQPQTRGYAKLIVGEMALERKQFPEALDAIQAAQKLHNSWFSHFLLGRTYVEAGHETEALAHLEECLRRKGESADPFIADTTTLRYLPPLYYWLGRAQEGTGTAQAARASYQEFLKLRVDADPGDPLVADAMRRSAH
jgi:tetratricopeptide (TPR) repeat protein